MSLFVDTSVWYAAVDSSDMDNTRAKAILTRGEALFCTDHVLMETWILLRNRIHRHAAERFWDELRSGTATIEPVGTAELEPAWQIGLSFREQDFSVVHRTSFPGNRRAGICAPASFDDHFAVFRFGPKRRHALEIVG